MFDGTNDEIVANRGVGAAGDAQGEVRPLPAAVGHPGLERQSRLAVIDARHT